jgi:hypothetical protein
MFRDSHRSKITATDFIHEVLLTKGHSDLITNKSMNLGYLTTSQDMQY